MENIQISKTDSALRFFVTIVVLSLAVGFPQVFHYIGGVTAGQWFLPMFIPVAVWAFYTGGNAERDQSGVYWLGVLSAAPAPVISSLLFGMPSGPVVWLMTFELTLLYVLISFASGIKKTFWKTALTVLIVHRLISFVLYAVFRLIKNVPQPVEGAFFSVARGFAGMAVIFVLMFAVYLFQKKKEIEQN